MDSITAVSGIALLTEVYHSTCTHTVHTWVPNLHGFTILNQQLRTYKPVILEVRFLLVVAYLIKDKDRG